MSKLNDVPSARLVGQSVTRREDPRLLTGRGRFTDDIAIAGLTCAMVLRSPHGHALIKSIDTSAALAMEGVVGILTYDDLRGKVGDIPPQLGGGRGSHPGTSSAGGWAGALCWRIGRAVGRQYAAAGCRCARSDRR
ncbi:hypothetical protein ACHMW6_24760 [Pseudoduganella sp. UC29_106]|uniref:hypothetical protein n=1 Tax=Pseudoduganella sp. UC29_106 TaxID=3374553 RepID=UPI0037565673